MNSIINQECIVCFYPIVESTFHNKQYIIQKNCKCVYNIHYNCLLMCLQKRNACIICEEAFTVSINHNYVPISYPNVTIADKIKTGINKIKNKLYNLFCCCFRRSYRTTSAI